MPASITLNTDQMLRFADALRSYPAQAVKRVRTAMKTSLEDLKEEMITEVPVSKPIQASSLNGDFVFNDDSKSGTLMRAIQSEYASAGELTGKVFINPVSAPYAVPVALGRDAMTISPRVKKFLRWVDPRTGRFAFYAGTIRIPAQPANPFHERAAETHGPAHVKLINEAIKQVNRDVLGRYKKG